MRVRRNVPLLFGPVNQPLLLFEGRADSLGNSYRPCRHAPLVTVAMLCRATWQRSCVASLHSQVLCIVGTAAAPRRREEERQIRLLPLYRQQRKMPRTLRTEEVLEACFADLLKGLVFDDEVMDYHRCPASEPR
jgi:hypothetical protein